MSHLDTHFPVEVKDQSIIQFKGQFDALAAEGLSREILRRAAQGASSILIDMRQTGVVLAEGIFELQNFQERYIPVLSCELRLVGITEAARINFQMYGMRFQNKEIILKIRDETAKESNLTFPRLITCPKCEARLRIKAHGAHACPVCKAHINA